MGRTPPGFISPTFQPDDPDISTALYWNGNSELHHVLVRLPHDTSYTGLSPDQARELIERLTRVVEKLDE